MDADRRLRYLQALSIPLWKRRTTPDTRIGTTQLTRTQHIAQMDWAELEQAVITCQACELYKTRKHAVFGVGNRQAKLLIVGEAPGAQEDLQGEPFVGRAGQLLTAILQAVGLAREQVYIANILKCRPPNNRDPRPHEVAACTPFLSRQVALIQPKLILALGRIAAHYLLSTSAAMATLRGQCFEYGPTKTPLIVTYHPAYLLRSPLEKRKVWQDLQQLIALLGQQVASLVAQP